MVPLTFKEIRGALRD
jgi:hypothetical protein